MNGYPRDMFEEMDEVFARLFSRMQDDMFHGNMPATGYRIVYQSTGLPGTGQGMPAPQVRSDANPVAEVHQLDDEVMVVAELPGAAPESVRLSLTGQRLIIEAGTAEMPYRTTADLPPVESEPVRQSFRNSVLEVTYRLLPEKQELS